MKFLSFNRTHTRTKMTENLFDNCQRSFARRKKPRKLDTFGYKFDQFFLNFGNTYEKSNCMSIWAFLMRKEYDVFQVYPMTIDAVIG
jgi:hypothetical protein